MEYGVQEWESGVLCVATGNSFGAWQSGLADEVPEVSVFPGSHSDG